MALTKITANIIEDGAISTASLANTSITADKLAATLDLTGKTITVATATAGDNDTTVASTAFVSTAIANLADSAPETLNTLNELAAALGDDANFSTTVTNSIALKAPLASPTFTGTLTANGLTVNTNALRLQSLDTSVNLAESIGDIEFYSNDSSTGGTGVQAKISAVDDTGFGVAYALNFLTGSGANPTERLRIASAGQIGIGGANYGTDGQILTSTGATSAPAWEDAPASGPSKGLAIVLSMIF